MFGLLPLPWWGYIIVLIVLTQITIFSVSIYLHRCQAHRALELHPIVSHFFRFWLWLTTGQITKEWAAIHRKHHARVETEEDPHSPMTRGITKVLFEGAELYRAEAKNKETLEKFGEGTPDDWIERHLYSPKSIWGIYFMLAIDLALFGTIGLTIWAIQMAWIPFFAAGVINGIGHYWGYRNYECKDASRNVIPLAFFLGGEELHNNHHAFATSAKFSSKWWEVDIGWLLIRTLQFFRLANPKRVLSQPKMLASKNYIDTETLKAVISYRFHLMANYTREVVIPMLQEEKKRAGKTSRGLLNRAKTLLVRDSSLMQASQKLRLATLLENFQSLRVVLAINFALNYKIFGVVVRLAKKN